MRRLLTPGDEGRQALNFALRIAALKCARWLGLFRLLRLLKGLPLAWKIGLRLARAVRRFAHRSHCVLPVTVTLIKALVAPTLGITLDPSEVRIILTILLLRRCDYAVVVLGMLVIIFGGNGIT